MTPVDDRPGPDRRGGSLRTVVKRRRGQPVRPRLTDVAAIAGVSIKTVSNVINGYEYIAEETRTRVLDAIDEVGYRPNLSARNLARGRAGVIALVLPKLDMPYFASLAREVIEEAERHGWFVLIRQTHGELASDREAIAGGLPQRIDGLVVSARGLRAEDVRDRGDDTPLVFLGEQYPAGVAPHVGIDNVAAARTATEHLVEIGRRRIAMVGARSDVPDDQRTSGYRAALEAAGLPVRAAWMSPVEANSGEEGERAVAELFTDADEMPDAIFAITDWVALGVVRALHLRGLRVPEDVAVVGFDDIPYGRAVTPALTTISPDRAEVAAGALELLEEQIQAAQRGERASPTERQVRFRLLVRESTAARQTPG